MTFDEYKLIFCENYGSETEKLMSLVRSGALSGYEKQVRLLGRNPMDLLAQVGLSSAHLRSPNTYIAYTKLAELLEVSARACGEPCFGLMMSERQNSSILGDLTMSIFRQESVASAIDSVTRFLYLHARGAHLQRFNQGETALVSLAIDLSSPLGIDQTMQMSVGQLGNFIADLLGLSEPGFSLLLKQPMPDASGSKVGRRLLSRIKFGSAYNGVRFPSSWFKLQPKFDQERLSEHLRAYLITLQNRYPDNLRDQVKDAIGQLLATGECSLEQVAATIDLQPRVLQLRLKELDCSYGALLRETRQDIAEQYLRHGSLSITDLALKLGYAEVSIFSRSFKAWTGVGPREWQRAHS